MVNIQISSLKEKLIVLAGTLTAAASSYLVAIGLTAEAALVATVSGAILTFWSEGVNTD